MNANEKLKELSDTISTAESQAGFLENLKRHLTWVPMKFIGVPIEVNGYTIVVTGKSSKRVNLDDPDV